MFEPLYREGTAVEGYLTKQEYETEIKRINETISKTTERFFNALPAKYNLKATSCFDKTFIHIEEEFIGNVRDYLPKERWSEKQIKMYERYPIIYFSSIVFPYHNMIFVLDDHRFDKLDIENNLKSLGYSIIYKRRKTTKGKYLDSTSWLKENQEEFLRELRSPLNKEINAFDYRTRQIMTLLNENIGSNSYQFAEFIPKRWISKRPYEPDELKLIPVKKLINLPTRWINIKLEELIKDLPLTRAVGITSRVQTSEGEKHIPMIDFDIMDKYESTKHLYSALNTLEIKGMVISSGNSYHFYGFTLLDNSEWIDYIQLLTKIPFVDKKWTKLQLEQGYSMLRLTPSKRKFSQPCFLEYYKPSISDGEFNRKINKIHKIKVA